jgi:hypothetical protein
METESKSPQPTHPAREGRTKGTLVALINLFLSVSLLLSVFAAWVFIPIANTPAVCVFHNKPWWISLIESSALILIPVSIVFGIVTVRSSKQGYRGLLLSLGSMNIVLGVLLILSLVWAEFLYSVCQL